MENKGKYTQIHFASNHIDISYSVLKKKEKTSSGKILCYIPAFGFNFSASNENDIEKKSAIMIESFFDYYHEEEGFKDMIIQIHKMGFRSIHHNYIMSQFLHEKKVDKANMKVINFVPTDFKDAETINKSSKLQIAS